tara:strand:+ start:107 stop:340 length:234 start_codon:yes stop_codon:yes gene_type:complete
LLLLAVEEDQTILLLVVLVAAQQDRMVVMVVEQEKEEHKVLEVLVQETVEIQEEHFRVEMVQQVVEVDIMEVVVAKL